MAKFLTPGIMSSFALWVLLIIVAAYFMTYYLVYFRQTKRWKQSNIPFLPPTFLLGHKYFLNLTKNVLAVPIDHIYKENTGQDLIGVFIGTMPIIILKDRKLIREISVKYARQTFATGLSIPESEIEVHYMINATTNEKKWKFSRTVLMPVFSSTWFQGSRFEIIKETIHDLWQSAEKNESDGSPMNVTEVSKNAILNIAASHFGIDRHSYSMKNKIRYIAKKGFEPSYQKVFIFFFSSILASLQKFECFKILPRKLCDTMLEVLKHQMRQREHMNTENRDLIDILRSLGAKHESKISYDKDSDALSTNKGITSRQMTGLGLVTIAGATESVHTLLGFAIHALSLYPEYQRRIRREVHKTLKKNGVSEFNYDVIRSLSFTFQCLFEVSRLFSPGSILRQCLEDFQVQGTNYIFRKGDRLIIPSYSLGRDEADFHDPHLFVPERFNFKDSLAIPGPLLSFGTGLRKCPGYQHGLFICAAHLASLLYKYEIKPRSHLKLMDATDFNPKTFALSPRNDILVDLIRCEDLDDV